MASESHPITDLGTGLEEISRSRQSGILTCSSENGNRGKLDLLLGHLFHAACGELTGDDAVVEILTWEAGTYEFEEQSLVPEQETVLGSLAELLARAQLRKSLRSHMT